MHQWKVLYKTTSYVERINTVHCCSTMTSSQTSSWQIESKQKDLILAQSEGKMWTSVLQDTGGVQRFTQLHTGRKEIYQGATEYLPRAAPELKITGTEEKILGKFCYICPVLKLICRLFLIVRERFWIK